MSLLGMIFGGVLSIVLWFELSSTIYLTGGERAAFVVAGIVESLLFVASVLGFVGAVVRKQRFVQIYAYFIYGHFLLNVAVAGYLLYLVTHFSASATVKACQETIKDPQAQGQCTGLLKSAQGVYFAIAGIVLIVEFYGAIIVARYVNQVKAEKSVARASRLLSEEAFSLVPRGKGYSSSYPDEMPRPAVVFDGSGHEFDPYEEIHSSTIQKEQIGYGGGTWTYSEITLEEQLLSKQRNNDMRNSDFTHSTADGNDITETTEDLHRYNRPTSPVL